MRSTFVCVLTLLICNLVALTRAVSPPVPAPQIHRTYVLDEEALDEDSALLAPIKFGALTLIPIVATQPTPGDDVLVLDEAMRTHELRVREVDGGRVDSLAFANASDKPVFVLAGEVILGGKQDRIVAATTVIPPHTTQTVPVRCVEHGRWEGKTDEFTTAETLAHDGLRANATYATQSDVWSEVKQLNERNATGNTTDTYRTLAMRQAEDARNLEREFDKALAAIPQRDRMIGYAVAYRGEVSAVDKFRSPALFAKLERKLLRSYIAQALEDERPLAVKEPCVHAVREFIADARRGEEERAFTTNLASTLVKRGTIASTSWVDSGDRRLYANYLGNSRIAQPPPPAAAGTCDRHLYPSYLGNAQSAGCRTPTAERRLYPSYLGNHPGGQGRQPVPPPGGFPPPNFGAPAGSSAHVTAQACADWHREGDPRCGLGNFSDDKPGRLRRTDEEPRLRCERSLHPGYIGNTAAWNECRRAMGLPVDNAQPR